MCANVSFKDTGFAVKPSPINTTPSGTAFTKVNSGNELVLKGVDVSCDISANIDDSIVPSQTDSSGYLQGPEINQISVAADSFSLSGIIDRRVSADMTQLGYLRLLVKSKGLKMFYYSSTTDGFRDITDTWGETTTAYSTQGGFTAGTTPVLFVRVTKLSIRQTPDSKLLRYTLNMVESTS